MAPTPVHKIIYSTGKRCLKALRKLTSVRSRCHPRPQQEEETEPEVALPAELEVHFCKCQSNSTIVTWLDDVRDLEDMENRLNEALEMKVASLKS